MKHVLSILISILLLSACGFKAPKDYVPTEQEVQEYKAADWASKATDMKFDNVFSDPEKAIEYLSKAIVMDPSEAHYYFNRALAYTLIDKNQDAIDDYTTAISIDNDFEDALHGRAVTYKKMQEIGKAIEDYTRLTELKPNEETYYIQRGVLFYILEDNQKAIEDFSQVISINPAMPIAYALRADSKIREKMYASAVKDLNEAITLNSRESRYYFQRGLLHEHMHNDRLAMQDFQEMYTQEPTHLGAAMALARITATSKDKSLHVPAQSIPAARRAVKLTKRENPLALQLLAASLADAGSFRLAELAQQEALRKIPEGSVQMQNQARFLLNRYAKQLKFTHPPSVENTSPFAINSDIPPVIPNEMGHENNNSPKEKAATEQTMQPDEPKSKVKAFF
ncbi:MAG: tetratricopeptide repeat protein [Desulfovibrio sp.]